MLSRTDLIDLFTAEPQPGVSILLPMHVAGTETAQNPIRFSNALREAERLLENAADGSESILDPARGLADDYDFWQHQSAGLAIYLSAEGMQVHRVPLDLPEQVFVGHRFLVAPLLPLLGEGESGLALTVTADSAHLYRVTRDALHELDDTDLPGALDDEAVENDYEAPAQASPPARPNTGTANISHAQVYGDSPPEWRETRLNDYVQKIERAVERATAADKPPVVLIAGADIIGRLRPSGLLTADVDLNPDALEATELHVRAWQELTGTLEAGRTEVLERYRSLAGSGDERGASELSGVRRAASEGRVDTLLVPRSSLESPSDDLAELLADTLRASGTIHLVDEEAGVEHPVAVLRY